MQKRVFTVWNEFSLDWLCVARLMMHFVRTFSIMRAYGVRLTAIEEVRNYEKIKKLYKLAYIKTIFQNGWWEEAYPSSYPPGSAPGHNLQKPSNTLSLPYFNHLAPLTLLIVAKRQSKEGRTGKGSWHWHNAP